MEWISQIAPWIAVVLVVSLFLGYTLRFDRQQVSLVKRTEVLEKKNSKEQRQIDELKRIVKVQGEKIDCLERKLIKKEREIEVLERIIKDFKSEVRSNSNKKLKEK